MDCEEGWAPKNWCFWTVVLEKTLESPLDCKEIQPIHFRGDQPWVFFGRNDAKAETPVLWPPHAKSWLIGKDSDAGRDGGRRRRGHRRMKSYFTSGWNGKQPRTAYSGHRAIPASAAHESLPSHAPALMWTPVCSQLCTCSQLPRLLAAWVGLWLRPAQQKGAFPGREQVNLFMKTAIIN